MRKPKEPHFTEDSGQASPPSICQRPRHDHDYHSKNGCIKRYIPSRNRVREPRLEQSFNMLSRPRSPEYGIIYIASVLLRDKKRT